MLDRKHIVVKSKQLIESKLPDWDAETINIFDAYLSRINPMDPDSSKVTFTKKEYEELIGVSKLRPEQLNRYIKQFIGNAVSLESFDDKGNSLGWDNYVLFDKATFKKNDYGEWQVTLRCHPELEQLFFHLKKSGYQKYALENTLKLKHKSTKLLYFILKDKQYRGEWTVDLKELRERISATAKMYDSFKDFNKFVLKRAMEEINKNTDITFSYEKVTRGRLTRAVKFKIESKRKEIVVEETDYEIVKIEGQIDGQMDIYNDFPDTVPVEPIWHSTIPKDASPIEIESAKLFAEACSFEFSWNEMLVITSLIPKSVEFREAVMGIDSIDLKKTDYLYDKYKVLNAKKDVKSRYGMMCSIVENDWKK